MKNDMTAGHSAPNVSNLAWLALIPTTAPALTADERGRIALILKPGCTA
jgi:hypothetical protein